MERCALRALILEHVKVGFGMQAACQHFKQIDHHKTLVKPFTLSSMHETDQPHQMLREFLYTKSHKFQAHVILLATVLSAHKPKLRLTSVYHVDNESKTDYANKSRFLCTARTKYPILPVFPLNIQYIQCAVQVSRDGIDNRSESIRSVLYHQVWTESGNWCS